MKCEKCGNDMQELRGVRENIYICRKCGHTAGGDEITQALLSLAILKTRVENL